MRKTWAIFKREIRAYFSSPVAYAVLGVFAVLAGFFFYAMTAEYLNAAFASDTNYMEGASPVLNVNEMLIRPLLSTLGFLSLLILPMLSMRLLAEENRSGTLQLLLTSPLSGFQIVMGKYSACIVVYALMLLLTLPCQGMLLLRSTAEWTPFALGYLGLFLMGASFLSLGLWISAITRNQIVAAVVTFGLLMMAWVAGWIEQGVSPAVQGVLHYISFFNHHQDMVKGVLDTSDLVYYGSVIGLGLFLAQRAVEGNRWRS